MRTSLRLRSTFTHRRKKACGKRLTPGFAAAVNSMACLISTQWYAIRTTPHDYCRRTTAETICTSMTRVTSRKEMRLGWRCSVRALDKGITSEENEVICAGKGIGE